MVIDVTDNYDKFQFAQALQITEEFFWNTYTDNYLELVKKRVFNSKGNDKASAVTCLRIGLSTLLRLLSPVLPTITEEIWSWCFKNDYGIRSIHQSKWPSKEEFQNYNKPKFEDTLEVAIKAIRSVRQTKTSEGVGLGKPVKQIMIQSNKHNINIIQNIIEDFSNASGCEDFVEEISLKEEIITKILIKETEF